MRTSLPQTVAAHQSSWELFKQMCEGVDAFRSLRQNVAGAEIIDSGIGTHGSLSAGLQMARICMGGHAQISIAPADRSVLFSNNAVHVRTDDPVLSCLGCQYAGWPVQTDDFFAMGSGPMRMARGREDMLEDLNLIQGHPTVVGILESDKLPTESAINLLADQCGVDSTGMKIAIAPSTSIAGAVQVVARSVETAMHKLHAMNFNVRSIVSATGHAPLPPPSKPGDTISGIGRTNDAMLYGATVTLYVDCDDDLVDAVADRLPSESSSDHGRPFTDIFKDSGCDFYKVDPMLFSPAVVVFHNLRSGRSWQHGRLNTEVLGQSFS